ncbi:MAG: GGDEF domain-containing protein [Lachnospiraceae bacterium]|nr:GGDEF domain-containing protein [Lachnospiraceae bacterium]
MNLQAIYVANFTAFLLILFLLISQFITRKKSRAGERLFTIMMYLVLTACLIEPLTFTIDGKSGAVNYWINLLGNTYLYSANGVGSFLFCVYVDESLYHSRERISRIYYKFGALVALLLLSLVINIWFGYYFYVDTDNVYHRMPLINCFYIYMLFCCFFSIATLYVHRHRYGKVAFFPLFMYLIPIVTGSVLQMLFYGVSLAWLGTAIGVVALYMSIQNQRSYLDVLTGLYNRLFLEHSMYRMRRDTSSAYYGIMLDMDDFKSINDTYGHSAGDQALRDAAFIFRKVIRSDAAVFRYAGDEFIILLKSADEAAVQRVEASLRSEADLFNETSGRSYRIGFSMGHAIFDHATDTEDSFLKKIDKAMYQNKAERHPAMVSPL